MAATRLVAFIARPLLVINLVLPPVIAEMYTQGKTGRLERTLRGYSTLSGVPSLFVLTVFMLLGGQILRVGYGDYYRQDARILMLMSAAKRLAGMWTRVSCFLS